MEFILFINVKKCWHLNSIFKTGEFLHVNKKTFTFKLTFYLHGQLNIYYRGQVILNFKSQCANLCPILYGDVSVMTHNCAGKILVQENIAPVDGYARLVHIFKRRLTWHGTSRKYGNHLYVKIEEYTRNEVRLT